MKCPKCGKEDTFHKPYPVDFNRRFRRKVRNRDNNCCMICNTHELFLKRKLDVHHVNYDKDLTMIQNSISLCYKCHSKTNFNRSHWIKFFQSLLTERYGYHYEEGKIIIEVEG